MNHLLQIHPKVDIKIRQGSWDKELELQNQSFPQDPYTQPHTASPLRVLGAARDREGVYGCVWLGGGGGGDVYVSPPAFLPQPGYSSKSVASL